MVVAADEGSLLRESHRLRLIELVKLLQNNVSVEFEGKVSAFDTRNKIDLDLRVPRPLRALLRTEHSLSGLFEALRSGKPLDLHISAS